jgi:hypothetical protein
VSAAWMGVAAAMASRLEATSAVIVWRGFIMG